MFNIEEKITKKIKELTKKEGKSKESKEKVLEKDLEKLSTEDLISQKNDLDKKKDAVANVLKKRKDVPFSECYEDYLFSIFYSTLTIALLTIPFLIAIGSYGYGDNEHFKQMIVTNLTSSNDLIVDKFIGQQNDSYINKIFVFSEEYNYLFIFAYIAYIFIFISEIYSLFSSAFRSIKEISKNKKGAKNGK